MGNVLMIDFKQNLNFLHGIMTASEPLLWEAIGRSPDGELKAYFEQHLTEELDHLQWLESDMAELGLVPELDFRAAAIAGSQYYLIRHRHPSLLLGYLKVLESWPHDGETLAKLESKYGVNSCRTLRYHFENDPKHLQDIMTIVGKQDNEIKADIEANSLWVKRWLMTAFATMGQEDL